MAQKLREINAIFQLRLDASTVKFWTVDGAEDVPLKPESLNEALL